MIEVKNISLYYDDSLALDNISFNINSNERVVLLGNNGCGKSSLLKLLGGLIFPNSGKYLFNNQQVTKSFLKQEAKHFRKTLSILFQDPSVLLFNNSVFEELEFSKNQFDLDTDLEEYAQKFNITHLLNKNPLNLSGGEKQKVALAIILLSKPKVLLLDEPTANLDPKSVGWLIDFLYDQDITTIISTHNLSLAQELGDRAIVMDNTHKIIYDGDIQELLHNQDILYQANLIHKHKHRHKNTIHSHFHIHDWS